MAKTKAIFYRMKSSLNGTTLTPYQDTDDTATQLDIDSITLGTGFVDTALAGQAVAYAEKIDPVVLNVAGNIMRVNNTLIWEDEPNAEPDLVHVHIPIPADDTTTYVHAAITQPSSGTTVVTTSITNPDVPRLVSITGNQGTCTGNVVIVGTDSADAALSATIAASGTSTVASTVAFKTVTSITIPTRGASSDTIAIGVTDALGIGALLSRNTVVKTYLGNTIEATAPTVVTSSTSMPANVITLNSDLNGTDVDFYYIAG